MNSIVSAASRVGAPVAHERQQLEERVEAHELNAGLAKDLGTRDTSERLVHDRFGVRIAVMPWIAEQSAVLAQQREIDAPRIDADRRQRPMLDLGAA